MKKYLFYYGYLGTRFIGLQKQGKGINDNSIVRYLEEALLYLSPLNYPTVYSSSRTDTGVHAVRSTFQAKLCLPPTPSNISRVKAITTQLNRFFNESSLAIRIQETLHVPLEFNCRVLPSSRTYLYRLGVNKLKSHNHARPFTEINSCWIINSPDFDLKKAEAACALLKGRHDFNAFCRTNRKTRDGTLVDVETVRTILECHISIGQPSFETSLHPSSYGHLEFYDIVISSKGFLWRQIRRMVGAIAVVAAGRRDLNFIQYHLDNPDYISQKITSESAPPGGLYLLDIKYPPAAFLEETYNDPELVHKLRNAEL